MAADTWSHPWLKVEDDDADGELDEVEEYGETGQWRW